MGPNIFKDLVFFLRGHFDHDINFNTAFILNNDAQGYICFS